MSRDRRWDQQQRPMPTHSDPRQPMPVDMRVSTDFLQCKPEQRLAIDDLVATIRAKTGSAVSLAWILFYVLFTPCLDKWTLLGYARIDRSAHTFTSK